MWEFYLAASELSFRVGGLMNFQIQMTRNLEAVPLTRNYIGPAEDALRRTESVTLDSRPRRHAAE
jgi:cyclopropane-fatty-acyl-phospholipid synthase